METTQFFYKKYTKMYFLCTIVLSVLAISSYIIFYIIIDPLQIFHKSWFQTGQLKGTMREQAAGIINNFEFDSIILGTSMLENTSSKEASEKIGGHFVNISLAGSNFHERSFVLRRALRRGVKNVLYSLDSTYINCVKDRKDYPTELWSFLYDSNIFNDIKIYITKKYITNYSPLFETRKTDMDRPNAWYKSSGQASRFGGLHKWVENINNRQVKGFLLQSLPAAAQKSKSKSKKTPEITQDIKIGIENYFNDFLLDDARKYKDTEFYLIFPPYFRFNYAKWRQINLTIFARHQYAIRYIVNEASKLENVHVYGFEDQAFLDDIANYQDTGHYHYRFNSYFLDAIASGKHKLTTANLDAYLQKCDKLAYDFDIQKLNNEAQLLIQQQGKKKK